ncbi:MAG TPA: hypothetical protein PKA20_05720 [Burkholderiaceae bacterium]|nr:hypothetical protein [Burkholderiaceae bacterium]
MTGLQLLAHALRQTHPRLFVFLAAELRREYGVDVRAEMVGPQTPPARDRFRVVKGSRR